MRKIVAGLMMSVDGVVEAPETWTGPYFSPEIGQAVGSLMANGDTMLLGRVTYQTFAASFAGNTSDPMAAQMNAVPKVVVSATLDQADWENPALIRHDVPQEITRLKEQPGQNINISGSATPGGLAAEPGPARRAQPPAVPRRGRPRQAAVRR